MAANPNAADNVKGIGDWWLGDAVAEPDVLHAALEILVAEGYLVLRRLPTGEALYEHRSVDARSEPQMDEAKRYATFAEFYPFYLSQHRNQTSRRLHFIGTSIGALLLVAAVVSLKWWIVVVALAQGYALAWIGHFYFEHNKPATFQYPLFSFMGDGRSWWETLTGKRAF